MENPQGFLISWPQAAVFCLIILSIGIMIGSLAWKKWWIKEGEDRLWQTIRQYLFQDRVAFGAGISAVRGILMFTAEWPQVRKRRTRNLLKGITFIKREHAELYRL